MADVKPMGILSAYEPSLRDRIAFGIGGLLGGDNYRQGNTARKIGGLLDFIPGLGDVIGFNDAYRDAEAGKYGMAAAGLGLSAAGLVPGVGDAVSKAGKQGIRAFHGSPHSFDKFDLSKIGTGDGTQAYGHGVYLAENEAVAKSYRDSLSKGGDGHMYEVKIDADPDTLLDWDKPVDGQSPQVVRDAINRVANGRPDIKDKLWASVGQPGSVFYSILSDAAKTGDLGKNQAAATAALHEAGIQGIKYLDAGSRAKDAGTRNYVVFDDSLIEIVKKYGIAAAVGAGIISQHQGDEMKAQGLI